MAFALSPLNLHRFPFKINPMVQNMHSTATDEPLLVGTVFETFFQVFKLHVDVPEQKRIFVCLIICLTIDILQI